MVILIVERVTPGLKGEMSRLALEVKPGVFISTMGARVRDKLWIKITEKWKLDSLLIYSTNNEQGFNIRSYGNTSREVIDFEGLLLTQMTKVSES